MKSREDPSKKCVSVGWKESACLLWWRNVGGRLLHAGYNLQRAKIAQELASPKSLPVGDYTAFSHAQEQVHRDCFVVREGANIMDAGRTVLPNALPRHRLAAGTLGTMGAGLGLAIAASTLAKIEPRAVGLLRGRRRCIGVFCTQVETICRHNLPSVPLVVIHNGICQSVDADAWNEMLIFGDATAVAPPVCLLPNSHYKRVITVFFRGKGYLVQAPEELQKSLSQSVADTTKPSSINIMTKS
ncbi:2-hydroxyacyl-CoA lyase 1-like [Felis catus]|uniref:2-hydroxyacyl-CoA lyase 1-like n=1 Tax=Felis catus TaxID=9685 RepID=UPI001D1A2AA7|nr:2-hydroxyacyl-CoA lyase 1-like [Felis catus]